MGGLKFYDTGTIFVFCTCDPLPNVCESCAWAQELASTDEATRHANFEKDGH